MTSDSLGMEAGLEMKIIDRETANKIRRAIEMTQVAIIFEEEKQQAVEAERKKAEDRVEAERKKAEDRVEAERKKVVDSERRVVIKKMIERGYPTEEIVFLVPGYSMSDVEAIRKEIQKREGSLDQ